MKKKPLYQVLKIFMALLIFLFLLATIRYFEINNDSSSIKTLFDAFWYSIVTLTTVGYGDLYPVTVPGKIVGLILILFSLGVLSYLIGQITHKIQNYMEKKKLGHFGTDFSHHVIIVGWNEFGKSITDQIINANQQVVAITNNKNDVDLIYEIYSDNVFVVFGEIQGLDLLKKANIHQSSSIFINMEDDSKALVYLINLRKAFKDINVVAYLSNSELKDTFYSAGATYVIPEKDISSKLIASFIFEPDVAKFTEDLITTATHDRSFDFMEFYVSEKNPYAGLTCKDVFVKIKEEFNTILMGISKKQNGHYELIKNPDDHTNINQGDYLIVVADGNRKKELEKSFYVKEGRMLMHK
jgi:voltage-gated potassium channel